MRNLFLLGGALLLLMSACKKNSEPYDPKPQLLADTAKIGAYLREHNETAVMDSAYGIFYRIIAPGNGVDSVKSPSTKVKTLYTGRLLNGTVFDSSGTTPVEFRAGGVIDGFQYGLLKLSKGGKIKLYLPSLYGYGTQAQPRIPANSVLIFDLELVDITNP